MNWGYKIVLSFVLFAGFVFYLVFRMMTSGNDLLKSTYYKSGPEINQELKLMENSSRLKEQLEIQRKPGNDQVLLIRLPSENPPLVGDVELTCLASDKGDMKFPIRMVQSEKYWVQELPLPHPFGGTWLCEMKGRQEGRAFLIRKEFFLN